jgi:hypothetical protein
LFYRLRRSLNYLKFNHQIRGILDTPPLPYRDGPFTIVSMVAGYDVQMYILAMKALYRRLRRGKIVAIVADDVSPQAKELIHKHLGPVQFVDIQTIDTGACPRGGTWERLVYIIRHTSSEFMIQMDCDVLCVGDMPEVLDCIERNRAFMLADGIPKKPLADWADDPRQSENVVIAFEKAARGYPNAQEVLYVRGSSGFAGFAKGAIQPEFLEQFHRNGAKLMGARWKEWGTEQLASNFVIANSPDSLPLPKPKYLTWERHEIPKDISLLHFLGYCRFDQGVFPAYAKREVAAIRQEF